MVMTEEEKQKRQRESNRKCREKNPEKHRECNRKWREANREKHNENSRKWYWENREKHHEYYEKNHERILKRGRKYREENPEKAAKINRKHRLKKLYNMTLEEWNNLFISQGKKCAGCEATEPGGKGYWHTDHIHGTKIVRGILCHYCNIILHHDITPDSLRRLANYVEHFTEEIDV